MKLSLLLWLRYMHVVWKRFMVKGTIARRNRHNSQLTNFCRRGGGNVGIKINKLGFLHNTVIPARKGRWILHIEQLLCNIVEGLFFNLPNVKLKMFLSFMVDNYFCILFNYCSLFKKDKREMTRHYLLPIFIRSLTEFNKNNYYHLNLKLFHVESFFHRSKTYRYIRDVKPHLRIEI